MKIGLVACSKRKLGIPSEARYLYIDTLFKLARRWVEVNCGAWHIVSGPHGLVQPTDVIEPYEHPRRAVDVSWGWRVRKQLKGLYPANTPVHFIFLIGMDYLDAVNPALLHPHTWEQPLKGLEFGERMHWFKERL